MVFIASRAFFRQRHIPALGRLVLVEVLRDLFDRLVQRNEHKRVVGFSERLSVVRFFDDSDLENIAERRKSLSDLFFVGVGEDAADVELGDAGLRAVAVVARVVRVVVRVRVVAAVQIVVVGVAAVVARGRSVVCVLGRGFRCG